MNKVELINAVSEKMEVTKKVAEQFIETFQEVVTEELVSGGGVKLVGFGTFDVVDRVEKMGRNPSTGALMTIPASKAPKFKAGKSLKDAVNNK